jgi:hypothetical protein
MDIKIKEDFFNPCTGDYLEKRTWATGAMPIGAPITMMRYCDNDNRDSDRPGWPELALLTVSAARVRMVAIATSSDLVWVKAIVVEGGKSAE